MTETCKFEAASLAGKQLASDQYAILAIMTAMTHAGLQKMDPGQERNQQRQNLRDAGKLPPEQTFGEPAGQIVIGSDGLRH